MNISEVSRNSADKLGMQDNLFKTMEECSELIHAISKCNRAKGIGEKTNMQISKAYKKLIEEVADVSICLEQLIYLNDIEKEVKVARRKAFEKISKRYNANK